MAAKLVNAWSEIQLVMAKARLRPNGSGADWATARPWRKKR